MARYRTNASALLLPVLLAGCGEWVHPTKQAGELAYDDASCRQQAIEKVQSSHQKQEAPKWMTRATGTPSYFVDGNDRMREQWHTSCLRMMGWTLGSAASRPGVANTDLLSVGHRLLNR